MVLFASHILIWHWFFLLEKGESNLLLLFAEMDGEGETRGLWAPAPVKDYRFGTSGTSY